MYPGLRSESTSQALYIVPRENTSRLSLGISRVPRKNISQPPTHLGPPGLILMVSSLWMAGKIQRSRNGLAADPCVVFSLIPPLVCHRLTEHLAGTAAGTRWSAKATSYSPDASSSFTPVQRARPV